MNLNQVVLIGRLGQDPEIKSFENGGKIATVNIAVDSPYYDKEKDHWVSNPDWIRCVFSNEIATRAEEQLQKGDEILVQGKIKSRKFTDKEENKRSITEVKGIFKKNHKKGKSSEQSQEQGEQKQESKGSIPAPDENDDMPF